MMPSVLSKITSIDCIFQSAMYILGQSYLYPTLMHNFLLSLSFPPYQSLPVVTQLRLVVDKQRHILGKEAKICRFCNLGC